MAWASRRQYRRYAPKELTFAVLHQACCKVGPIVSISRGGLAFEYLPLDEFEDTRDTSVLPSIDIIVGEAPLFLSRIPCEILYDFSIKDETFLSQQPGKRCCGLKFGTLSADQVQGLEAFLCHYVAEKKEPGNA